MFGSIPLFRLTGIPFSWFSVPVGFVLAVLEERKCSATPLNFEHLTERVMLYIVFTFGEMVVRIAEYFEGGVSFISIYYSAAAFLVTVGLLLIYGFLYNHMIDRQRASTGALYMVIHILMIISLNNITTALGFLTDQKMNASATTFFLIGSVLLYYLSMFFLQGFAYPSRRAGKREFLNLFAISSVFAILSTLMRSDGRLSSAVLVTYIYLMFFIISRHRNRSGSGEPAES